MDKLRISAKRGDSVFKDCIFYHYKGVYIGYSTNIGGIFYRSPGIYTFAKEHGL